MPIRFRRTSHDTMCLGRREDVDTEPGIRLVTLEASSEEGPTVAVHGAKMGVLQPKDTPKDTPDVSESVQETDTADDMDMHAKKLRAVENMMQGFLFGASPDVLLSFLRKIVSCQQNYGIFTAKMLSPKAEDGVFKYRENKEYSVIRRIHGGEQDRVGVYLCRDNKTNKQFILKRIQCMGQRLIGIEFLCQENKNFLPKIYGVFKNEKDEIHIFQEYVEGGTLDNCKWNLKQIRQFAEQFLEAFRYLHGLDLAHGDVKMMNVVVRNPEDPRSFVIIDFESMKRKGYCLHDGGHTNLYLPPWHERKTQLKAYDPILQTFDLWATGCILINLMTRLGNNSDEPTQLWGEVIRDIRQGCPQCKSPDPNVKSKLCENCWRYFLTHLKLNGHDIIKKHFRREIPCKTEEENRALGELRSLLDYLTSGTTAVETINVHEALGKLRGGQLNIRNRARLGQQ